MWPDQSEASIEVTWLVSTNQRPRVTRLTSYWSRAGILCSYWPCDQPASGQLSLSLLVMSQGKLPRAFYLTTSCMNDSNYFNKLIMCNNPRPFQCYLVTSFTSTNVKLRSRFVIHLTFTWRLPDRLTIIWPSPDPYITFISHLQLKKSYVVGGGPTHYRPYSLPQQNSLPEFT